MSSTSRKGSHTSRSHTSSHSPSSHSPRSHSPRSHSPRSHSPRSHSPRSHSPRSHSPRSASPHSHSPRSHSPHSSRSHTLHSPNAHHHSSSPSHSPRSSHTHTTHTSYVVVSPPHSPRSSHSPRSTHSPSHSPRSSHSPHLSQSPRSVSEKMTREVIRKIGGEDIEIEKTTKGRYEKIGSPTLQPRSAEVVVKKKETWDIQALQKLEEKLAKQRGALIDMEKEYEDQVLLYKEAQRAKSDKLRSAEKLEALVAEKASERDRWLAEERELEHRRAAAHTKAVELETKRTETLAQAVLAREEAKVSDSLSLQRQEGIKQAKAMIEAHRLAMIKLEEHREELKRKEIDVSVRGDALPQPKAVDIKVAVKALDLPEARVSSAAVSHGAGATSHIHEALPAHSKTVISPKEVHASEKHVQQTVERHIVKRDQIVS